MPKLTATITDKDGTDHLVTFTPKNGWSYPADPRLEQVLNLSLEATPILSPPGPNQVYQWAIESLQSLGDSAAVEEWVPDPMHFKPGRIY